MSKKRQSKSLLCPTNKLLHKPVVSAKTENQKKYIQAILENDIVICEGPAGTGKTHIAIGIAVHLLDNGTVERIFIARPVMEAGESIGYLPGGTNEKLDPYIRPIMDELRYYATCEEIENMKALGLIEIVPIGFMRGRTFKRAFIVVDECQNAQYDQLKMILSRFGEGSKMILTGDTKQSDLSKTHQGGLKYAFDLFSQFNGDGIACIQLTDDDIIRHKLVRKILNLWEKHLDGYRKDGKMSFSTRTGD